MPSIVRCMQTTALPVGQGLAVKIGASGTLNGLGASPSFASTVLFDLGGPKQPLSKVLARIHGDIGLLILSHFDADHISGVPRLLDSCRVRRLWIPGGGSELRLSISADNAVRLLEMGLDVQENCGDYAFCC